MARMNKAMQRLAAGIALLAIGGLLGGCAHRIDTAAADAATPPASCDSLTALKLDHAQITAAEEVSEGRHFSLAMMAMAHQPFPVQPGYCRVQMTLTPSPDSDIRAEVWLPLKDWNGRLQGVGNGGMAGGIETVMLTLAVGKGFAAVSTDTGHHGNDKDGSWALNHPEKVRDYGWRAVHESTLKAKTVVAAFYGHGPRYSYFTGGSYGGRTALKLAQRFPDDYDGIIAGCPAYDGTNGVATVAWIQQRMAQVPGAYLPASKLPAIEAHVVAACDALDGVKDGVIDDPRRCHFKPESMLCKADESDDCLTAPQAETLRRIYAGPGGGVGDSKSRGFEPGGEDGPGAWKDWHTGTKPGNSAGYLYGQEFYRYFVYGDPTWGLDRFNFEQDRKAIREHMGPDYDARDPDLSRFKAHGGKLIMYHGWADGALPPLLAVDYYDKVRKKMGADSQDQFMRFYMAPGMHHCAGGPGPTYIGQIQGSAGDSEHNISAAMQDWVEHGKAPETIIASKYDSDLKPFFDLNAAKLIRTRPLCRYPKVARWTGQGSTDDAANFRCVVPPVP